MGLVEGSRHVALSTNHLTQHNVIHSKPAPPLEWIVVRIEVSDTGCGIRPKDMVQSKLFCMSFLIPRSDFVSYLSYAAAFNQTEAGRLQGGKGTGLGLALVRQIVKLSGGRLGLQSKAHEGSTFWVEIRESSFLLAVGSGKTNFTCSTGCRDQGHSWACVNTPYVFGGRFGDPE